MPKVKEELAVYNAKPKSRTKLQRSLIPPRKRVSTMLSEMEDSATYEDILRRVYVLHNLEEGEKDFREGRVFSNEEVEKMIDRWLK
jgi:hypothetical protein